MPDNQQWSKKERIRTYRKKKKKEERTKPEVMIISPINQGILLLIFFHLKKEIGTKKGNSEPTKILKVKSCYCTLSEFSWRMKRQTR